MNSDVKQIMSKPRGEVFDVESVEETSDSSEETSDSSEQSETEEIRKEASQRKQAEAGVQVEEMQPQAISALRPQGVVFDEMESEAIEQHGSKERRMMMLSMESLMVGLKFAPTDEELIGHYLRLKNDGRASEVQVIPEVDFYKYEPWRLPKIFPLPITSTSILSCDGAYIFFCRRDGNYKNTFRDNNIRATSSGYWKAFSKDRHIRSRKLGTNNTSLTATKKTLVFYLGHGMGVRTEWVMHEFCATDPRQDDFVLCRLFRFPNAFPTAGGPCRFAEADLFPMVHELGLISNTDKPDSFWSRRGKGKKHKALDRDLAGLLKPIITLRPPRVVFDDATVKRTSHSSERTKFEIEEIGDEASQMNPEGIQESLTDEDWTGPLERLFAEEGSKEKLTLEPQAVVFDVEAVKMTSNSSEQTKFEIEEIGNEASQTRQPGGIQVVEMQTQAISTLKPQRVVFANPPKDEDWENAKEIYLVDNELSVLPENPRCPELSALFIQRNYKLRTIPPSFFDHMPALQILNLSRTGIKSLPDSVISLVSLKRLFLNDCHRFMMLSPNVGELKQLEVLDLDKTQIMDLPKEIKKLTNLTCLEVSFCGTYVQSNVVVIPCGVISALSQLEELNIDVDPDDERWDACVEAIVNEVCTLKRLETLKFYFPRLELLRKIQMNIPSLFNFRFIVGRHVKRLMSRVPPDVEIELKRWERCLKYINGVGVPREIQKVLQHATAFFLDRHASIKKISDFGNRNMEDLKCLVIGECNEVQVIIDQEDDSNEVVSEKIVLGSLEYMYVYYMKSLWSIWEGSVQRNSLCLLKSLTLVTCPQLTTIFTQGLLANLCNLEELKVEDCPSINSLVSFEISAEHKASDFLPNLKKISLHYMPGLVSISGGLHIAPKLEWLSFYNCPNLKNPLIDEVSTQDLKKIKGERSWWEALEWSNGCPGYLDEIFVQIDILDC